MKSTKPNKMLKGNDM